MLLKHLYFIISFVVVFIILLQMGKLRPERYRNLLINRRAKI